MDWKAGLETSSPFVARFGEPGARLSVIIEYADDGTLAPFGTTIRDHECEWGTFLVGERSITPSPGQTSFATAELGVRTIGELNERGHTAVRA